MAAKSTCDTEKLFLHSHWALNQTKGAKCSCVLSKIVVIRKRSRKKKGREGGREEGKEKGKEGGRKGGKVERSEGIMIQIWILVDNFPYSSQLFLNLERRKNLETEA
jgi:hypothetical protein